MPQITSTKYNGPPKVISLINAFSPYKKAGFIHDKSLISFTVTGFANPTISANSCAVKICNVGNNRNQLPFISKHIFIFRQTHSDFCFRRGGQISPVVRRKLTISALTWSGTSTCTQWLASGIRSSWSLGTHGFSSSVRRKPK